MKRIILSIAMIFILVNILNAKSIDVETAKKVGMAFLNVNLKRSDVDLNLAFQSNTTVYSGYKSITSTEEPLYYVFNAGADNGFIMVAGDDNSFPVLCYTKKGSFDKNNMPPNFRKWIEGYKEELDYIIQNNIIATPGIKNEWSALKNSPSTGYKNISAVSPLLSTTWSQSPYYNGLCPGGSVTGCVATAMAQIMKYWGYPDNGTGFHSYNEDDYGTLSANFGGTTYQWSSMPGNVTGSNNAVATLMYHCGVSVDMNYSPTGSGAYVISSQSPVTHCSEYAFTTYFSYDNSVQGVERVNYTTSSWIQMLKVELDGGRPVEYAGFGTGGGHAFVCDGYDINDYFHFNWGWGGAYDGYFLIDALNPGGTDEYNDDHQAVIGIKPPSGVETLDMKLYNDVTPSSSSIAYGQGFNVKTNILNDGAYDFNGDYCAAIFDNNKNFIDYVEIKTGWSLQSGYVYVDDITFSTGGLLSMLPGPYYIGIFYRVTGENWVIVADGSYSNMIQMTVTNANDIELNSAMIVTPGTTLAQGDPASVNLNIINTGSSTFYGTYSVDLYDLEGSWVEEIEMITESSGLPAGYTYLSPYLTFNTSAITSDPGTYLLAVQHIPSLGDWELTGSSYYQNPIFITVTAPTVVADIYEPNDTEPSAYNLPVSFSGSTATKLTTGSNSHTGSDHDYYGINLPAGYNYSITARAHDSYNSGNGQTYTNDVLWSFSTGGLWSKTFDDVTSSNIIVPNGGNVKFHVAPYFEGEIGTYLLDIQILRTAATGVNDPLTDNMFRVFPNPAAENIYVINDQDIPVHSISVIDITGQKIKTISSFENTREISIPVQDLANGSYILTIQSDNKIIHRKFIKF